MKTHAVCRIPLVGCLLKASEYKNISENWQPINQAQENFKRHLELKNQLSLLSTDEFDSTASTNEDEINEWLAEKGFTLKCPPITKDGFATASVAKFLVEWLNEASKTKSKAQNGEKYDYAYFTQLGGKLINLQNRKWDMAKIPTKDENTQVFLAMSDDIDDVDDEDLLTLAQNLQIAFRNTLHEEYENVNVPMLNLDLQVSQDWITGMKSGAWCVEKCLQQFILKFNEKGAVAKSAASMIVGRGCVMPTKQPLTFNKPFILWFSRDGVTYPLFLSVCGYDCWAEPDNLD